MQLAHHENVNLQFWQPKYRKTVFYVFPKQNNFKQKKNNFNVLKFFFWRKSFDLSLKNYKRFFFIWIWRFSEQRVFTVVRPSVRRASRREVPPCRDAMNYCGTSSCQYKLWLRVKQRFATSTFLLRQQLFNWIFFPLFFMRSFCFELVFSS